MALWSQQKMLIDTIHGLSPTELLLRWVSLNRLVVIQLALLFVLPFVEVDLVLYSWGVLKMILGRSSSLMVNFLVPNLIL